MTEPEIVLDLTRLASRIRHATPTGVDRVEMAYARELLRQVPERLSFGLHHPLGGYGRLPTVTARQFLDATAARWAASDGRTRLSNVDIAKTLVALRPRRVPPRVRPRVLIQASPNRLNDRAAIAAKLRREGAAWMVLIHDLIPIEYPEYARPGGAAKHIARMETVAALADGVLANSTATMRSFEPFLERAGRDPARAVALLGIDRHDPPPTPVVSDRPYFVCIGTIEPRKNHLLLLHLWRQMSMEHGAANMPKLILIGRRGWENEQVLDLLDRCPALVGCVEEHSGLNDNAVRTLTAGARALLLPSFAEGFGMPVPEALVLGTPVVCSDLPALREVGGEVPLYLDPLDGPAWRRAVADLAEGEALEDTRQAKARLKARAISWAEHVRCVRALADQLT